MALPIVQLQIEGELLEPPQVLEQILRSELGPNYVAAPSGPERTEEAPLGTEAQVVDTLRTFGYESTVQSIPVPGGMKLLIRVKPIPRIRQVYVWPLFGKFPLLQEEIQPLTRFRAGQPIPEQPQLERAFAEDQERIARYLQRQGYFEGTVWMSVRKHGGRSDQLKLDITLNKGDPYQIDDAGPNVEFGPGSDARVIPALEIRDMFHHPFRLTCLWLCGEFSLDQLRRDTERVRRRYQNRGFYAARVAHDFSPERGLDRKGNRAFFTVHIVTGKRAEVLFRGNRHLDDDELAEQLTFTEAGSVDRYECDASARELQRIYQKEGYFQADVSWTREEVANQNLVRITFVIDEGPELKIRTIDFVGNSAFTAETLRGAIESRPFPALGLIGLGEGGYLTTRQLEQDEERIVELYRRNGYPNTHVRGEVATREAALGEVGALAASVGTGHAEEGNLYLRFLIDEGPQVRVEKVSIELAGHPADLEAEAWHHVRLRPGQPYTDDAVKADRDTLERWLKTDGYRYAEVKPKIELSSNATRIAFQVQQGPRVRFGQTILRGNFKTNADVITRELRYQPGDVYDESKIEQAERNLRSLDLFTTIRFQFHRPDATPDIVHTYLELEERHDDHGRIEVAFGYATDYGAYATTGYLNRNVFGWGQGFETSVTYGQRRFDLRGTYIWPRLFGNRLRFELTGFWRTENTVRLGNIRTKGVAATLSRELLPRMRLFMRYELRQIQRPETFVRTAGPSEDVTAIPVETVVTALGPGIDLDRRDNVLMPTKGFFASTAFFFSAPFLDPCFSSPCQNSTYLKLNVTAKSYVPLGRGIHVAMGLRYDHGFPIGADLLPKVDRFFAGGDTTVRGIEEDQLKTELISYPVSPLPGEAGYRRIAAGGNIRILNNLELIFPLRASVGIPLQAALFLDTGIVTNSLDGLRLADFRHSVGIAPLRFVTPIGFGSLEYAWPLDPQPGDDPTGRFHFNFGFVF